MQNNELLQKLINSNEFVKKMNELCEDFASKSEGRLTMIPIMNRKRLTEMVGRIDYDYYSVDFVYTINLGASGAKSVLSVNVRLDRTKVIAFSIYDLMYLLDENDFSCYLFPYIENIEKFTKCFLILRDLLEKHKSRLVEIAQDPILSKKAYDDLKASIGNALQIDIDEILSKERGEDIFKIHYGFYYANFIQRFSCSSYNHFLEGNYEKAINTYSYKVGRIAYEDRMLEYMLKSTQPYPKDNNNTLNDASRIIGKYSSFLSLTICSLIMTLVFSLPLMLLYYLLLKVGYNNCIYTSASDLYNIIVIASPSMLLGISSSNLILRSCSFYVPKKDRKQKREYDRIVNTSGDIKKLKTLFNIVFAIAAILLLLQSKLGIAFYEDGFTVKSTLFEINSEYYNYDEISTFYILEGYNDDNGKFTEYKDALIKTTRGEDIIFSYLGEFKEAESKIIPILEKNGVKIEKVKSKDEIK